MELEAEKDMPIEKLMAKYNGDPNPNANDEDEDSDDGMEDEDKTEDLEDSEGLSGASDSDMDFEDDLIDTHTSLHYSKLPQRQEEGNL